MVRLNNVFTSSGMAEVVMSQSAGPLQYSCLENPMDGGAWWAAVYESRTRLKQLSSSSSSLGAKGKRENTVVCMNEIFTIYEQNRK